MMPSEFREVEEKACPISGSGLTSSAVWGLDSGVHFHRGAVEVCTAVTPYPEDGIARPSSHHSLAYILTVPLPCFPVFVRLAGGHRCPSYAGHSSRLFSALSTTVSFCLNSTHCSKKLLRSRLRAAQIEMSCSFNQLHNSSQIQDILD